jgi:hypothetical protein
MMLASLFACLPVKVFLKGRVLRLWTVRILWFLVHASLHPKLFLKVALPPRLVSHPRWLRRRDWQKGHRPKEVQSDLKQHKTHCQVLHAVAYRKIPTHHRCPFYLSYCLQQQVVRETSVPSELRLTPSGCSWHPWFMNKVINPSKRSGRMSSLRCPPSRDRLSPLPCNHRLSHLWIRRTSSLYFRESSMF